MHDIDVTPEHVSSRERVDETNKLQGQRLQLRQPTTLGVVEQSQHLGAETRVRPPVGPRDTHANPKLAPPNSCHPEPIKGIVGSAVSNEYLQTVCVNLTALRRDLARHAASVRAVVPSSTILI